MVQGCLRRKASGKAWRGGMLFV